VKLVMMMHDDQHPGMAPGNGPGGEAPAPPRKFRWPALVGAGIVVAAVIGVIVIRADDTAVAPGQTSPEPGPQPTITTPEPATTSVPDTAATSSTTTPAATGAAVAFDGPCITVTVDESQATGCPQTGAEFAQLDQRVFVADLDGPVIVTSGSADPFLDLSAAIDDGEFASRCRWDDLAPRIPDGGLVEIAVCNDTGVMGLDVVRLVPDSTEGENQPVQYFSLPTQYLPEGADLGPGTPITGLPGALAFTAPVQDITTCSILLLPNRSGWKEACGFIHGLELATALVQIAPIEQDGHELSVTDDGLITSAQSLEAMAPSSGCSLDSAGDLLRALPASSIVMGLGCIDDQAALTTGSVLTQQGPPDGSIWTASRSEADVWAITDSGTGIDTALSFPIVSQSVWETWPASTVPGFRSYWWEPIVAIATQPTVDGFATELLAALATLDDEPEFPQNERIVDVQPAGLPLIIAQVDIGGDDSVVGQVIYVWLDEQFDENDPIGWRAGEVLVGEVCGRGESAGELCI
jgi:hypothetical protein